MTTTTTTTILLEKIRGMVLDERGYIPIVLSASAWEKDGRRRVYVREQPLPGSGYARKARDYAVIDVNTGIVTMTAKNLHPTLGREMLAAAQAAATREADGAIP